MVFLLCKVVSGQELLTIFAVIVGFYFGTQSRKKEPAATHGKNDSGSTIPNVTDTALANKPFLMPEV